MKKNAKIDSEFFLNNFFNLKKININLIKKILDLLIKYYCNIYNKYFVTLFNIHII